LILYIGNEVTNFHNDRKIMKSKAEFIII
jgi:hypothetical protein